MRRHRFGGTLLAIALAALATSWLLREDDRPAESAAATPATRGADFYLRQGQLRRLDGQGRLLLEATATYGLHFPDDRMTRLEDVTLTYYGATAPWRLRSQQALVPDDRSEPIVLQGEVHVQTDLAGPPRRLEMQTALARLRPGRRELSIPGHVVFRTPLERLEARGLEAALETGEVRLLAEVRGRYAL
ncbi:MAG: LPS export ABC transporter periplasmic protein LptC [Pseudomonadota bacterium]|nr:LPS export ABC transporter periplasmic protein LptC [Pseudomonadota bacterium]HJO36659.1 LPS export ABC transporter periplasmic protein LptC [Gammaproteobacteria bacterium]